MDRIQSSNRKVVRWKLIRNERTRVWATDFLIGIGMFTLVFLFASVHQAPALPAPLAKTNAVLAETLQQNGPDKGTVQTIAMHRQYAGDSATTTIMATTDRTILIGFMALVFSALTMLTIHFWRSLRRAYASPRRKWGKG